jgi:uridine phosphorylase
MAHRARSDVTGVTHSTAVILEHKQYDTPSVFVPEHLLREARRQKATPPGRVPSICVLDPDGDIVRHMIAEHQARLSSSWACYHTQLYQVEHAGTELGIIGGAVGASFAVLVAEELFASGCELLISVTSAGLIRSDADLPFFLVIDRALRDEGTSYHYLPPSDYAHIDDHMLSAFEGVVAEAGVPVRRGSTWTTDAPFRETRDAIDYAASEGIVAVEMEAAALYAFARARGKPVVCFAHVTNRMGRVEQDFEKGDHAGSQDALRLIVATAHAWLARRPRPGGECRALGSTA